ncbi:gliding motility-associated C-terminal domain-containing protein [Maribacter litoralis]|uniref:T9SS type B sorting domain-containing protein n=1 Tax=Maribacter litoralis TaxID=2059726 RepID=UPI0013DEAFB0|nr:gliding motility-associated C-terminal domain-containing protein [Maribacter litoralis]
MRLMSILKSVGFNRRKITLFTVRLCITILLICSIQSLSAQQSPGGITTGLELWLKADAGFTYNNATDAEWLDQSANAVPLNVNLINNPDAGTVAPLFVNNVVNFNPGLIFDGANTGLASAVNATDFDFTEATVFSVQQLETGFSHAIWHYGDDGDNDMALFVDNSVFNVNLNSTSINNLTDPDLDDNIPHIFGFDFDPIISRYHIDASEAYSNISTYAQLAGNGAIMIGLDADSCEACDGDNHMKGGLGDVIIFNRKLSEIEKSKVETYLALKYGISLDQSTATNYLSSDGTVVWDGIANVGYKTDIFGLGRDDDSGLDQKVSRSVNDVNGPVLSTTQHFTEANNDVLRTTSLGDNNFIMMAHNNAANTFSVSFNGGTNNQSARVWKVDETGTVGSIYFAIPKASYTFPSGIPTVILSDDMTFANTDTLVTLTDDGTHYWAEIDPTDAQYIALASTTPGFTVSETALIIDENADTETFTVVLDAKPTNNVLFNVSSSDIDETTVDLATLTFTPANWNIAQTVTVTGVNDDVLSIDHTATITISVNDASSDDSFDVLADKTVAITLTNDDVNFTIDAIDNISVNENLVYISVTPSLSGATPIGSVTYTLSGNDAADFTIVPTTGVVSMVARDYENPADANTDNVYEISITVTDSYGNNDTEDWTVSVADVSETVTFTIDAIANANVNENVAYTSVTPSLSGAAPIGSVTYTLSGNDAADFTIDPSTGVVSMVARDYENPADANTDNVYEISITATDSDGNSDSEVWMVEISDGDEIAGDTDGDGTIGTGETAGDTDGDGTIGTGETAGDTDGDGTIGAGEIAGDTDGDGTIGTGETAGDTDGDGTIGAGETAGDTDGDGTIGAGEIAGDTDGDGTIGAGEIAGDTDGDGTIGTGETAGDTNGDGTIGTGETAGDTDGDGTIGTGEIEGDTNGDGTIGSGETTGDVDTDSDGVPDDEDAFPNDPNESVDSDEDGIGANTDLDDNDVNVGKERIVVPAQAFTPNGDNINDTWIIKDIENYPNAIVAVYNRYGHEVFKTINYKNDWNGRFKSNSEALPSGSYYYVIDLQNGTAAMNGWIFINY